MKKNLYILFKFKSKLFKINNHYFNSTIIYNVKIIFSLITLYR